MDVAQAPGRLLHVGLAHVGRGAELAVALIALGERGLEELGEVLPVDVLREHLPEAVEEPPVADEIARLLHGGAAGEVGARHRHAVGQAPHRVAHLKAEVPERVEQPLGDALDIGRHLAVEEEEQIQIGQGMQLPAPVAPQRDQHHRRGLGPLAAGIVHRQAEQGDEEAVHEGGVRLHRLLAGGAAQVGGPEEIHIGGQVLAQQLQPEPSLPVCPLPRLALEALLGLGLHPANLAEELG